ncbi:MAG: hypothetical protein WKF55_11610 [Gemmatimonadaceae bacterium]
MTDTTRVHKRRLWSTWWFWPFTIAGLLSNIVLIMIMTARDCAPMSDAARIAMLPAYATRLVFSIPLIAIYRVFKISPGYSFFPIISLLSMLPFVGLDMFIRRVRARGQAR